MSTASPTATALGAQELSTRTAVLRQEAFVARHEPEWLQMEAWLVRRARSPRQARATRREWTGLADEDVPAHYRRLCQQLALARRRGYSPAVVDRLQALTQRGHDVLYRARRPAWSKALGFFIADFPRLVRAQRGCLWLSLAVFALPALLAFAAVLHTPEFAYTVYPAEMLSEMETMYDPDDPERKLGRDSGSDVMMFGYYVMNNVSIAFRTFAAGFFAGIGTLFVLLQNGLLFGVVGAHLQNIGHGDPFWRFVCGHAAPELTAIVIAGAAGLRIGLALVAPGRRRRVDALVEAGRTGALLSLGCFAMLVFAAFVEAFWSSMGFIPAWAKYAVAGVLWTLTLGWLALGGRAHSGGTLPDEVAR